MKRYASIAILLLVTLVLVNESSGCSVPVFRYALERWDRDEYRVIVASKGALSPEQQQWVEQLEQQNQYEEGFCNLRTVTLDVTDPASKEVLDDYPDVAQISEPTVFLFYPYGSYLKTVIYKEPLTEETVKKMTASAFIDDVTMDIVGGASAVWILVDSGNQAADDEAFTNLTQILELLSEEIELPAGIVETSGNITGGLSQEEVMMYGDREDILQSGIPLKIEFTLKRLTRSQDEPILRQILLNCNEQLKDYQDQPMVFPVFGRGRFLLPLVGEGISLDNIGAASMYVCGSCSCQVKSGNPGVDLLTHIDWYSYLDGINVVQDRELPPLTGISELTSTNETRPQVADEAAAPPHTSPLKRNLILVLGAMMLIVIGTTIVMAKHKRG